MSIIVNSSVYALGALESKESVNNHKYPIEELQQRAIHNSLELQVLEQAIKTAESKKWTSLAPGLGIGNNFVGRGDIRFNLTWNVTEALGGGKIREINLDIAQLKLRKYEIENKLKIEVLDIAQLKLRKYEIENKLKIEVLELVLALERAERKLQSDNEKLDLLQKRLALINSEYKNGKRELDSLTKYWEIEMSLRDDKATAEDEVTLNKAKLEQLVGSLAEFIALRVQK